MFQAVATCGFGLESVVAGQLRHLKAEGVTARDGRVYFQTDGLGIAAANIGLSTAERVLIVLAEFPADTFDMLFDGVQAIAWTDLIGRRDAFPVKGYTMNSALFSVPACQSIIKKAVVNRLSRDYGSALPEDGGVTKRIQFSIVGDICTVMLDTSGDGLHKRGYRPLRNMAPIRETVAAGIADFARVDSRSMVCDPFCGSGTLVIESALRALGRAVGVRRSFAGERYSFLGDGVFAQAREQAKEREKGDIDFAGRGSDLDPAAVELAKANAKRAGVERWVSFQTADALDFSAGAREIIMANPPYGQRLGDEEQAEQLIADFSRRMRGQTCRGIYIISNNAQFEQLFGRRADKRRKLYNGTLPCQLYMYLQQEPKKNR